MALRLNFDTPNPYLTPYAVVVDVETTGLPRTDGAPTKTKLKADSECYPRIVQIAWLVLSENGELVSKGASFIKQEKKIPIGATRIHGITTEFANAHGRDLKDVLLEFSRQIEFCDYLVAFNVDFDQYTIEADCLRVDIPKPFKGMKKFCAMKKAEPVTGRRFAKLEKVKEEIGISFYQDLPENMTSHNAELDCVYAACIYCFLVNRSK